jgi:cyanobactin maturation PatA/PatG family protease
MPAAGMLMRSQQHFFPSWGDARIRVAVLDGRADLDHPCFQGAEVELLPILSSEEPPPHDDELSAHGTQVASILFGQHGSDVDGLVPNCSGFIIPIFCKARSVSQLDLARAIELAVEKGAHVINISGGQLTDFGEADVWLHNAIRLCCDSNVLVIAAAGNDGCECLHVPAALPNVLAVGALDRRDQPMAFSNWGEAYRADGIMAPGQDILGARPGGGTVRASGTSFATPLVSGAAALLLSEQAVRGQAPDPLAIRRLLIETALPCEDAHSKKKPHRCLAGKLNLPAAFAALTGSHEMTNLSPTRATAVSPQCACGGDSLQQEPDAVAAADAEQESPDPSYAAVSFSSATTKGAHAAAGGVHLHSAPPPRHQGGAGSNPQRPAQGARLSAIAPSQSPDEVAEAPGMVFSIGVLGYDFGTEARRDTFKQRMRPIDRETGQPTQAFDPLRTFPPNPYDARQMVDHLTDDPSEARSLIWTLNIDLTPVYAIEPVGPYAADVYDELRKLLDGEVRAETEEAYVERVSIPGLLSGRNVRLFSGQVVPVIEPQNKRGIFGWHTNALVTLGLTTLGVDLGSDEEAKIRDTLAGFLNRVYYDLRNLGKTSKERALNFAVTNAFQAVQAFTDPVVRGFQLDEISVEKSPFCRMDGDCWDVKLKFFDPDDNRKAKRIIRYTIDVSDLIPVAMGEPRSWQSPI